MENSINYQNLIDGLNSADHRLFTKAIIKSLEQHQVTEFIQFLKQQGWELHANTRDDHYLWIKISGFHKIMKYKESLDTGKLVYNTVYGEKYGYLLHFENKIEPDLFQEIFNESHPNFER